MLHGESLMGKNWNWMCVVIWSCLVINIFPLEQINKTIKTCLNGSSLRPQCHGQILTQAVSIHTFPVTCTGSNKLPNLS